jgi:hypothetical protein
LTPKNKNSSFLIAQKGHIGLLLLGGIPGKQQAVCQIHPPVIMLTHREVGKKKQK